MPDPTTPSRPQIAVIGAGAAGTLVAIHLARTAPVRDSPWSTWPSR